MRKVIAYSGLLAGIAAVIYSAVQSWNDAAISLLATSYVWQGMYFDRFVEYWLEEYCWLTAIGGGIILVSLLLILLFRKCDSKVSAAPASLVSGGIMLEAVAFVQAWSASLELYTRNHTIFTSAISSSAVYSYIPNGSDAIAYPAVNTGYKPWLYLGEAYADQLWFAILGVVFILVGMILHYTYKRKAREEVLVDDIPEEPAEVEETKPVPQFIREEAVIVLYCTVMDIRGDYALVKYDDTGIESEVAIALLPFGIDVGDRLKYQDYEFERT